mmetsp:Transcript_21112/g.39583  ORF Transcript_21112/g.39583 Transcript_21112/m.39583 type:complete len:247 (+) Transcript_21112:2146-2886(+)
MQRVVLQGQLRIGDIPDTRVGVIGAGEDLLLLLFVVVPQPVLAILEPPERYVDTSDEGDLLVDCDVLVVVRPEWQNGRVSVAHDVQIVLVVQVAEPLERVGGVVRHDDGFVEDHYVNLHAPLAGLFYHPIEPGVFVVFDGALEVRVGRQVPTRDKYLPLGLGQGVVEVSEVSLPVDEPLRVAGVGAVLVLQKGVSVRRLVAEAGPLDVRALEDGPLDGRHPSLLEDGGIEAELTHPRGVHHQGPIH